MSRGFKEGATGEREANKKLLLVSQKLVRLLNKDRVEPRALASDSGTSKLHVKPTQQRQPPVGAERSSELDNPFIRHQEKLPPSAKAPKARPIAESIPSLQEPDCTVNRSATHKTEPSPRPPAPPFIQPKETGAQRSIKEVHTLQRKLQSKAPDRPKSGCVHAAEVPISSSTHEESYLGFGTTLARGLSLKKKERILACSKRQPSRATAGPAGSLGPVNVGLEMESTQQRSRLSVGTSGKERASSRQSRTTAKLAHMRLLSQMAGSPKQPQSHLSKGLPTVGSREYERTAAFHAHALPKAYQHAITKSHNIRDVHSVQDVRDIHKSHDEQNIGPIHNAKDVYDGQDSRNVNQVADADASGSPKGKGSNESADPALKVIENRGKDSQIGRSNKDDPKGVANEIELFRSQQAAAVAIGKDLQSHLEKAARDKGSEQYATSKFYIFEGIFEEVIAADCHFGQLLRLIKEAYDERLLELHSSLPLPHDRSTAAATAKGPETALSSLPETKRISASPSIGQRSPHTDSSHKTNEAKCVQASHGRSGGGYATIPKSAVLSTIAITTKTPQGLFKCGTTQSPQRNTSFDPHGILSAPPPLDAKGGTESAKGSAQSPQKETSQQASPIETGNKEDEFLPSIAQQMLSPYCGSFFLRLCD